MSHNSGGAKIQTEDSKQGIYPHAPSKGPSMEPLALTKPPDADSVFPPELLDLIIQNVKDARSLRCLGLASRLFAAVTRRYRLGILSLTEANCAGYMAFCQTTASDAPNLVWELRLDWGNIYTDNKNLAYTKIFPRLEGVLSLSLQHNSWSSVAGTLHTAHIHTLSLRQEFFPHMAGMAAFFRNMPALKTVLLSEMVEVWKGRHAPSGVAMNECPAISELRLTDVRSSGGLLDHVIAYATPFSLRNIKRLHIYGLDYGLVNFLTKLLESTGDMDELIITPPELSFGYLGEEEDGEEDTKDEDGDEDEEGDEDDGNVEPAAEDGNHVLDTEHQSQSAFGPVASVHHLRKVTLPPTSQPASSPPGLRLQLFQFTLSSCERCYHDDDDIFDYMMPSINVKLTSTRLLRWLTSCFSQSQLPPSIRTIEISISADANGDILDFVNARLWRKWDAQLARCGDRPPDVNITVKSIIREGKVKDEVEDKILSIVMAREEEALKKLRQCIERNMANVRRARRLRISTEVCQRVR